MPGNEEKKFHGLGQGNGLVRLLVLRSRTPGNGSSERSQGPAPNLGCVMPVPPTKNFLVFLRGHRDLDRLRESPDGKGQHNYPCYCTVHVVLMILFFAMFALNSLSAKRQLQLVQDRQSASRTASQLWGFSSPASFAGCLHLSVHCHGRAGTDPQRRCPEGLPMFTEVLPFYMIFSTER